MSIAYFDCFSGVAGDMLIGAFIDAGLPIAHLEAGLASLNLGGYRLVAKEDMKGSIGGINFSVQIESDDHFRKYSDIEKYILESDLNDNVKTLSLKIFSILAEAEAKVHRREMADVHFHEVGGIDSIVDIIGSAIAVDYFKFDKIYSSPLPVTRGFVKCAHGRLPVPAPATLEILKGIPVFSQPVDGEIVTPTGASVLKAIATDFCDIPLKKIEKVGYGFGDREFKDLPNGLRLMIGE